MIRKKRSKFNICFIGGNRAGIIGALSILSSGHTIVAAVSFFNELTRILRFLKIPVYSSSDSRSFLKVLQKSDILINVHGREILTVDKLDTPKLGCYNVHPYLYCYKGFDPIKRALVEKNHNGSVGVHKMTAEVDEGPVIVEKFMDITGAHSEVEIYNMLYPVYSFVILKALSLLQKKFQP